MTRERAKPFPTWVILSAVLFFILVAGGLFVIAFRDLPEAAKPEWVEARFAEQIAFLKTLAVDHPGVPEILPMEVDGAKDRLEAHVRSVDAWSERLEGQTDLFDDPALVGISIYPQYSAFSNTRVVLKDFEDDEGSWFDDVLQFVEGGGGRPEVGRPSVSHWRSGKRHLVRYINLFLDDTGQTRGYGLVFDLNRLSTDAKE